MDVLTPDLVTDEISARDAPIDFAEIMADLEPEKRLLAAMLQLAVSDLDAALHARGTLTPLTDDERLHAASAAFFFLKGPAAGYMKLLGVSEALPEMQDKAIRAIGALGGAWAHLARLKTATIDRRMLGAMDASRTRIGLARMPLPAREKAGLSVREIASLI